MSAESLDQEPKRSFVEDATGDLFDAPNNAVLIHACNCVGSWGAGIAKTFKAKYPTAYKAHNEYCKATAVEKLIGTCQLIPPQQEDYQRATSDSRPPSQKRRMENSAARNIAAKEQKDSNKQWIACLFTSRGYGKATETRPGMDKPDVIVENTRKSLQDLRGQLLLLNNEHEQGGETTGPKTGSKVQEHGPGELWSCKFNSGLFAVDWADTRKVMEEELKGLGKTVRVVSPVNL